MKHEKSYNISTASDVLSVNEDDVPAFVTRSVQDRSLHWIVSELNDALLFGAQDERDDARKALSHLGFV